MLARIISGIVCGLLVIGIILINVPIIDSIFVTILAIAALFEFYKAFKDKGIKPISIIGYLSCIPLLFIGTNVLNDITKYINIESIIVLAVILSFIIIVLTNTKRNVIDIAVTILGIVYIPLLFAFLKNVLFMDLGRQYIWYVIFGAVICDMFAYFIGKNFGKHKLCQKISPGKTIEGAIAGVIAVAITFALFTLYLNTANNMNISVIFMTIVGIVASIVGQFGDLFASLIKRYCGIKDFSNTIPGHGGVLDRLDSVLFVAPIIYVFLKMII